MKYIEKGLSAEKDLWPITVYIMQKMYMYFQIKRHPDHLGRHFHHQRRPLPPAPTKPPQKKCPADPLPKAKWYQHTIICTDDSHCEGQKKCCRYGCYYNCLDPLWDLKFKMLFSGLRKTIREFKKKDCIRNKNNYIVFLVMFHPSYGCSYKCLDSL